MFDISLIKYLPTQPKIPFIRYRYVAFVVSVIAIIASMFLFFTRGLNYGLDFKGGTVWEFHLEQNPSNRVLDDLRGLGPKLGLGELAIQTIDQAGQGKVEAIRLSISKQPKLEGDDTDDRAQQQALKKIQDEVNAKYGWIRTIGKTDLKTGTEWIFSLGQTPSEDDILALRDMAKKAGLDNLKIGIDLQEVDGKSQPVVRMSLETDTPYAQLAESTRKTLAAFEDQIRSKYARVETLSVQSLGTKVSGELKTKGILAVVLALFFVLLYIWFRFEWQFGAGAVLALAHDVSLTIGVFSLTQLEFNLSIVAAILTIVGYSLNDTVIVYDRIRENMRKFKKMPLAELLNVSINDTLSRTIMTSFTTMLALFALYLWGGAGLHNFAFAMIWGVLVGTYSSIFVASPLLLILGVGKGRPAENKI